MSELKDFFISYSHTDQRWAEWIAWHLEAEGYQTMLQAWDFLAGSNFVIEMDAAAKQATRTIALLSPDYVASPFTPSEWAAAFKRDPTGGQGLLIPVRVRPFDVEGLLGQIVYIDLVDKDEAIARATLLQGVKHERRKPPSPPVFPSTIHAPKSSKHPSFPGALPAIWNIPYPRNPYFTGREELLRHLASSLRAGQTVGISQPQGVSGLGGVGKTQIVLEFAYRYYQDYDAVLWTRADTQETLISGFVALADLLQLTRHEESDQLKVVQTVKSWLTSNARWLLILDNAEDLALLRDFLPQAGRGHILFTTRAASMGRLAQRIEVDALDIELGALLLLRRAYRLTYNALLEQVEDSERAIALLITQELGGLPLALDQAGAYIEETQCSLEDYLRLYRTQRAELLNARGGLVLDHPEPVATTWSLSFAQVEKRLAVAADLLRVCAFLHPDAIPEEIITEGATALGPELQAVAQNPLALNQAIRVLLSYSLLKRQPEEHLLSVHRLVQVVLKDGMDVHTYHQWAEQVVQAAYRVFPSEVDYDLNDRYQRYLPHALECGRLIVQEQLISFDAALLLLKMSIYLMKHARYPESEAFLRHNLRIWEQVLGSAHSVSSTLIVLTLAFLNKEQSKYAEAESLFQRTLYIWEHALEPDPLIVAITLNGLAVLYKEQERYPEAEPLYQRALHIFEQSLGNDHPRVVSLLDDLAKIYEKQGKLTEAEPLFQRALRIRKQVLGPNHPTVAYQLNTQAALYKIQGDYEQAKPLYERALAIYEQALGPNHPDTNIVRQNYTYLLEKMKQ